MEKVRQKSTRSVLNHTESHVVRLFFFFFFLTSLTVSVGFLLTDLGLTRSQYTSPSSKQTNPQVTTRLAKQTVSVTVACRIWSAVEFASSVQLSLFFGNPRFNLFMIKKKALMNNAAGQGRVRPHSFKFHFLPDGESSAAFWLWARLWTRQRSLSSAVQKLFACWPGNA